MFIESETSAVDPFQSPNFCGERLLHEQYNKGPVSYLRRYRKPSAFTGVASSITCCKVTLASIESIGLLGNHLADIMAIFSPSAKPIVAFFGNWQSCMHEQGNYSSHNVPTHAAQQSLDWSNLRVTIAFQIMEKLATRMSLELSLTIPTYTCTIFAKIQPNFQRKP